jgi:hypothetical protein
MAEICEDCRLAHPPAEIPDGLTDPMEKRYLQAEACVSAQVVAMRLLVNHAGKKASCDGPTCGRTIYWITHTNGKRTPYDESGLNHFVSCPDSDRFKRARS